MAQIDVTDILSDPEFMDPVILIHRKPIVDEFGENQLIETQVATFASVQPTSGKTLQRLPEALRVSDVSSFWIKGKIIADGKCQYPDVIVFRCARYAVQMVFDWSFWGNGWSEGVCVREKPSQ